MWGDLLVANDAGVIAITARSELVREHENIIYMTII